MATVKVLITSEEIKEKVDFLKLIKGLDKSEKEKLKGFLQGLAFAKKDN